MTSDKIENQNRAENAHIFSTNGQYSDAYALENSKYEIVYGDVMLSFDKTFAELGPEIKNGVSHRAKALEELERKLSEC